MSVRDLRVRELWHTVRQPVSWGFAAAAVGVVVSFVIPSTYVVRTELSLNSAAQATIGASLLGLAQQFGLGDNGGAGTPDFLVALFTSEDVLESAVQMKVPRVVYADLWFTDCSTTADTCDPIRIWKIDGKNTRDTLERAAKKLTRAISVDLNPRSGIIQLSVEARTPQLALALAQRLVQLADSTNLELQRQQARDQFRFMQDQVESARVMLQAAEDTLAAFDISNRSVQSSPTLVRMRARMERKVALAESFYVQLRTSLNQLFVAAANNVSTVGIVESPKLPGRKNWPKRTLIVVVAFVLGSGAWAARRHGNAFYEELRLALTTAPRSR